MLLGALIQEWEAARLFLRNSTDRDPGSLPRSFSKFLLSCKVNVFNLSVSTEKRAWQRQLKALSFLQLTGISEADWKWKCWHFQILGLAFWNEWLLRWQDGKLIIRAQLYLYWHFCGCYRSLMCISMCAQLLNAYLGCGGMLKTPATMILKWVLSMALMKSMNYEKPKEGPRRKIPPPKKNFPTTKLF